MGLALLAVVAGFGLLVWGADRFVSGAAATADNLGVPTLIVGLTIVGFGTSAPEMLVSGIASWLGSPQLGVGNALGSNITNIGLVVGVTALIVPLTVNSDTLRREFPILFAIMVASLILMMDGDLSRFDGAVLLSGMVAMVILVARLGMRSQTAGGGVDPMETEYAEEIPHQVPMPRAIAWLALGLVVMLVGSRFVVWGASSIAVALGISELVIGLTVVAIGTSLPELAASVMSVMKNEPDIAIGNVVGSNMFNLLGVMGLPGLIYPHDFDPSLLTRDYTIMFGMTLALFFMSFGFKGPGRINRLEGLALLVAYTAYLLLLYRVAT